jgi:L-lactate dehydrogenase complex protein LldG
VVEEARRMTVAKDEILARIRAIERTPPAPVERAYRHAGTLDAGARLERFAERVADYKAEVRVLAPAEVPAATESALRERGAARVGIPAGLPAAWRPDALDLVDDGSLDPHELDKLDGVVTACTVAIAETGTIVLTAGPAEGRRALSLVPDLHVCVVERAQIVELVPEAMAALEELVVRERRPLTFVSGPSATSDIELSRVEGVHGPRTLVVLIVNEEKP